MEQRQKEKQQKKRRAAKGQELTVHGRDQVHYRYNERVAQTKNQEEKQGVHVSGERPANRGRSKYKEKSARGKGTIQ
eukprot:SAG31_NODE_27_length_32731_cov_1443.130393_27_plen_77_part_00